MWCRGDSCWVETILPCHLTVVRRQGKLPLGILHPSCLLMPPYGLFHPRLNLFPVRELRVIQQFAEPLLFGGAAVVVFDYLANDL